MKSPAYIENERQLAEINATLNPPKGEKTGKIGIFAPGKNGDVITCMSVLPYIEKLWPNKDIIWYCNMPVADALRYSNVSEVRTYPWEGLEVDPYTQLMDSETYKLRQNRKLDFEITADLEDGYFPCTWMVKSENRVDVPYTEVSKLIFNIPSHFEWKPLLGFSIDETNLAEQFIDNLPQGRNIIIETSYESGQSGWNELLTQRTKELCEQYWGSCNFIIASELSQFTVRQCALLAKMSNLFVGVSSGISVAASCFKNFPMLQYCNSVQCSTYGLSEGIDFHLIAPNQEENEFPKNIKDDVLQARFENKLIELLNKYK